MSERRYSEEEVARIFERAAENQQSTKRQLAPAEGMTLADLQEIGRDVGISPALVAEAAKSLDAPKSQHSRHLLGLPIGVGRTIELDRRLSPAEWDRLVVDLRETFDARGVVKSEGNFKQWTNGNLQALVEPTATGDRVRLQTIKGSARSAMAGGLALLGTASLMTLINGVTGPSESLGMILAFALGGLAMLAIPVLQLPSWARQRRLQMEGIASRLADNTDASPPEQA
ncbi:MAG TPA: hypothetical protein VGQ52_09975 [Gemmatimonadaceae bacterium]|nr:hypothetical protein [Gemmatimonadaceae bacterium]